MLYCFKICAKSASGVLIGWMSELLIRHSNTPGEINAGIVGPK